MRKIRISTSCEPYMYNTDQDMKSLKAGDVIEVKFKRKSKVKKDYAGKKIKFFVNNILDYSRDDRYRRIAIIPIDKKDNFKSSDAIIIDEKERFEGLMIDLFPCNRRPYAGWKNKEITFTKTRQKVKIPETKTLTLRDIELYDNGFIHPKCSERSVLRCYGGFRSDKFKEFQEALAHNEIEVIGYDKSVPEVGTTEFNYHSDFFDVKIKMLKGEYYYVPGYLFKETEKEFKDRLYEYVEKGIEVVKVNSYGRSGIYNAFSVVAHYLGNDEFSKETDKLLSKFSKKEKEMILDKCIEQLKSENESKFA